MIVLLDDHYLLCVEELAYHITADVLPETFLDDEDGEILMDEKCLSEGVNGELLG